MWEYLKFYIDEILNLDNLLWPSLCLDAANAGESLWTKQWDIPRSLQFSWQSNYFNAFKRAFCFQYWLCQAQRAYCEVHSTSRTQCRKEVLIHVHYQLIDLWVILPERARGLDQKYLDVCASRLCSTILIKVCTWCFSQVFVWCSTLSAHFTL